MIPSHLTPPKASAVADATTLIAMGYAFANPDKIQGVGYWAVSGFVIMAFIRLIPVVVDAYIKILKARNDAKMEHIKQDLRQWEVEQLKKKSKPHEE